MLLIKFLLLMIDVRFSLDLVSTSEQMYIPFFYMNQTHYIYTNSFLSDHDSIFCINSHVLYAYYEHDSVMKAIFP
jgi:hypothetical protein